MKFIATSDWQAEFANLDSCEQALIELLRAAVKHSVDAIIIAGDLKDAYNPVDLRVAKFWVRAIRRIRDRGFRVIILLGNHDRISQSVESKNWLDILRAAGAETISKPKQLQIKDVAFAFLPFTADKKQELKWAQYLYKQTRVPMPTVLVFHTEIRGAEMNSYGIKAAGTSLESLHLDQYSLAIGGHLHMHQQLDKRVWYIGSPFCQDWGEANQTKGIVLVEIGNVIKVRQLVTSVPHWYDAEWLAKHKLQPLAGDYVRSRVRVTSKKITDQLRAEEERLKELYPGARIYVVPKLEETEEVKVKLKGATDQEQIAQYVAATLPEGARFKAQQAVGYLSAKLVTNVPCGRGRQIRFLNLKAENVLTFREVGIRYSKQGLVLLRGENHDWLHTHRSNGSGKTNTLSLLPIAMFGQTLKKQKADDWVNERSKGSAKVILKMATDAGTLEIERHRPHKLLLRLNGKDVSTGIRGTGKVETQGVIEQLTGYDMKLLLNAIYIDQTISNAFVFGSQGVRMELINKLQNLERYEAAQKLVTADIKRNEKAIEKYQSQVEWLEDEIDHRELELAQLKKEEHRVYKDSAQVARTTLQEKARALAALKAVGHTYELKQGELDALFHSMEELTAKKNDVHGRIRYYKEQIATGKRLVKSGKCGACGQPSKDAGTTMWEEAEYFLVNAEGDLAALTRAYKKQADAAAKLGKSITGYQTAMREAETECEAARNVLRVAINAAQEEQERNDRLALKREAVGRSLEQSRRALAAVRGSIVACSIDRELLEYAKVAFSKGGIPMYLSAALCPVLNAAADEFSELFTEGKVKLKFSVKDEEFNCDIINPAGSRTRKGQSVGESAMAGIVCAFAIRETAPKTNLLVLDEPGHGLDAEGAKQFAKGLLKLADRYETILVTTHHPAIEGVLSGGKIWTVKKNKGISRLSIT